MEKVLGYFKLAVEEGGKIEFGGDKMEMEGELAGGYFVQPTVISG
jgi:aldehyde dehydrogenase